MIIGDGQDILFSTKIGCLTAFLIRSKYSGLSCEFKLFWGITVYLTDGAFYATDNPVNTC